MSNPWKDIPVGTIVDADIHRLAIAGELISNEFEPARVRQACYELRASSTFWDVTSTAEDKRVEVGTGAYLLKPNCYVIAIVMERVQLPSNVLGRILTKGQLFALGILPVNTYADPGFEGRLGITLYNASKRYIWIRPGDAIAKMEFSVLPKAVSHAYSGQHGYETAIWPIPVHHYAKEEELRVAGISPDDEGEIAASFGPTIAQMAKRLRYYERAVWVQISITIACFAALFVVYQHIPFLVSLMTGVLANLMTTLGINAARRHIPRRGGARAE